MHKIYVNVVRLIEELINVLREVKIIPNYFCELYLLCEIFLISGVSGAGQGAN